MQLTLQVLLATDLRTSAILLRTIERFNAGCNYAAQVADTRNERRQYPLHRLVYRDLRERFGLSAQMAVRAISKVADAFKSDPGTVPTFRKHGAMVYDERILSFKGKAVSIATLEGRLQVPLMLGDYQRARLRYVAGQADLLFRKNRFYLYCTIQMLEESVLEVNEFVGVDCGLANIAADSDGVLYTGESVEQVRSRILILRGALARRGSKNAKRHLVRLKHREANFRRNENHRISKQLVERAKDTGRGIGLEELSGIRSRTTVGKSQRAAQSGWSFFQLQSFVSYKAQRAGVPIAVVDPRNSSRECSRCRYVAKRNRASQSVFSCLKCGFVCHADINAAINISKRAAVNRPIAVHAVSPFAPVLALQAPSSASQARME